MRIMYLKLNNKRMWLYGTVCLLLVILVYGGGLLFAELARPEPVEAVRQSLLKTINAPSYRYTSEAIRTLNNEDAVISAISGEKSANAVHLKGTLPIINAEVEVYRVQDTMYRRDSLTKDWVVIPAPSAVATEQLIAEINPLAVLEFPEDIEAAYAGTERVQRKLCRVYEIIRRGENKYLELYWTDYTFKLWIDKREGLIRKAEVRAEHRDNSQHLLRLNLLLWDFNETIEIEAPILKIEVSQ